MALCDNQTFRHKANLQLVSEHDLWDTWLNVSKDILLEQKREMYILEHYQK